MLSHEAKHNNLLAIDGKQEVNGAAHSFGLRKRPFCAPQIGPQRAHFRRCPVNRSGSAAAFQPGSSSVRALLRGRYSAPSKILDHWQSQTGCTAHDRGALGARPADRPSTSSAFQPHLGSATATAPLPARRAPQAWGPPQAGSIQEMPRLSHRKGRLWYEMLSRYACQSAPVGGPHVQSIVSAYPFSRLGYWMKSIACNRGKIRAEMR